MTIYTVLSHENSDYRCGAEVRVFKTSEEARAFMRRDYEGILNDMDFDRAVQSDTHSCEIGDDSASVLDGINSWYWEVEEHDLDDDEEEDPA